ncbi:MAG: A24 family peptidase [Chloroflexota bacterium]|nr:A24 family peptidase [Chloroflexota bacterium]
MPPVIEVIGAGLIGLLAGRLLNSLMDSLPQQRPGYPLRLTSCPHCRRPFALHHYTPLLGHIWHQRACGVSTPFLRRALVVEALTPPLFGLTVFGLGMTPLALLTLTYLSILSIATVSDLEHTLIPNRLVYPALPLAVALAPWGPPAAYAPGLQAYVNTLAGLGVSSGVLLGIHLASRGRMGAGDVKLAALIGAMLGFPLGLVALGLAVVGGGVVALGLVASRRKRLQDAFPYGPFLSGGAVLALLWGQPMLNAYLGLLGFPVRL